MRRDGDIMGDEFTGKFAQTNNPLLRVKIRAKQPNLFD